MARSKVRGTTSWLALVAVLTAAPCAGPLDGPADGGDAAVAPDGSTPPPPGADGGDASTEPLADGSDAPDAASACGNGACEVPESCADCAVDCGACEPDPGPAGFPTYATTGPDPSVALTPSGSLTVTTDGAVIENLDVTGNIVVHANHVTLRNVRITGTAAEAVKLDRGYANLTMERIEIRSTAKDGNVSILGQGIYGEGAWTLTRSRISGYPDGLKLHSNQRVEGNYFFGNVRTIDAQGRAKHTDGMQTSGGHDVVIRNNTFATDFRTDFAMGSNMMIQNEFAPVANYLIEGNRFSGGNFCIYLTDKGSGHGPHQNVVVRDNVFVRDAWQYGPVYLRTSGITFSGNTFDDGAPLTGPGADS